jgi:hypothetical protein
MEQYQSILGEEVRDMAYETGAVKREGKLDVATFVQTMIFGYGPRSRDTFKWIGASGVQKRGTGDRISDQPTFYAGMCQSVSESDAKTVRSSFRE